MELKPQPPYIEVLSKHWADRSLCPECEQRFDFTKRYTVVAIRPFRSIAFFAPLCATCADKLHPELSAGCKLANELLGDVPHEELPEYCRV